MEAPRLERKLVAILAADVEGYSRHMERDEAATLAILSAHRLIVDDLIASYHGRITGTAGDVIRAIEDVAAQGADTVYFHLYGPGDVEHIRLLGSQVVSRF